MSSTAARRTAWIVAGVLVLVVAVGVALTVGNDARPVSVDEARQRTTTTEAGRNQDTSDAARPTAGVYRYRGSGTESLSTPPLSQEQGPTMPGTVELLDDGCWTFRIDYSSNHWQNWTYCPDGPDVTEVSGSTWQRWMIGATAITNLSTFDCDPGSVILAPDADPDDEFSASCTGTSDALAGQTVSTGPQRFVGVEALEIDGVDVSTQHFVSERTMTGAQVGTDRSDVWFDARSGLPVRNRRSVSVDTDTPVGTSTYTETGEWVLESTAPA